MKKILSAFAALVALTACNSSEPKAETAATNDGKAIVENYPGGNYDLAYIPSTKEFIEGRDNINKVLDNI